MAVPRSKGNEFNAIRCPSAVATQKAYKVLGRPTIGPDTRWAVGPDGIFIGDNAQFAIEVHDLDGVVHRIIRATAEPAAITVADRAEYRRRLLEW